MSKKISLNLVAASTILAVPFLGLNSCDSGPVDTSGESDFDLGTRFDGALLSANPTGIAEMPQFLLAGDTFVHAVDFTSPVNVNNRFLTILPDQFLAGVTEEYGRGFQFGDPAIVVNASGQISNTEGEGVTDNVNYIYDPDSASFRLTEQNSFVAGGEDAQREEFEDATEAIENANFAGRESLAEAFTENLLGADTNDVFEAAIESIGLVASDQGSISTLNPPQTRPTNTTARIARTIRYIPSSTNAQLIANGEITGTVQIIDTIADVVLINFDERGNILSFNADNATILINTGRVIDFIDIDQTVITYEGPFTYSLSGGDGVGFE